VPETPTAAGHGARSGFSRAEIEQQAAIWVGRMTGRADLDDVDAAAFHSWLRADPRHAKEYQIRYFIVVAGRELPSDLQDRIRARIHARIRRRKFLKRVFSPPRLLAGSAVALASAAALVAVWIHTRSATPSPTTYATKTAETRAIQLTDASVIELNSRTQVQWSLNGQGRWIDLLSGEVYIDVAHDVTKPFRVRVEGSEIRALGTRFDVYKKQNTVVLTVAEGTVEVTGPEAGNSTARWARRVSAPRTLEYQMTGAIQTDDSSTDALQWRAGVVQFREKSLAEAVEELGRYTDRRVKVDQRLMSARVGGIYSTRDVAADFTRMTHFLPMVVHEDGHVIALSFQEPAAPRGQ
jgi:transmembrane sensor